jgi:hypothetical protein
VNTSSKRLKPDPCQTHQHKTDLLTPYSPQTHAPTDLTHSLVYISCYQSRHCQNLMSVPFASHERCNRTFKRDGHWSLYRHICVKRSSNVNPRSTLPAELHHSLRACALSVSEYCPQIELIPARNASLAAMHGSASGSNVRYYPM